MLGWSVDQFWRCTLHEFFDAVDGWMEANGAKRDDGEKPQPANVNEKIERVLGSRVRTG